MTTTTDTTEDAAHTAAVAGDPAPAGLPADGDLGPSRVERRADEHAADEEAAGGLRRIAAISASLVSTYALTSVLGLAFWLLAARQFSVSEVGVGGAAISMMTLLGTFGTVGLGTLLISRLPRTDQGDRRVLVRTALAFAATVSVVLALVVPLVAYHVAHLDNLAPIVGSPWSLLAFAAGTALMSVGLVADQAVLVLGSGRLQTERNALASVVKLAVLGGLALAGATGGMTIFVAWGVGTLVSLPLVAWRTRGGRALEHPGRLVDPTRLRGLGRLALSHHALNTTLQAPLQLLPLLVLVIVSSRENGIFTSALQVTGVVFTLPYSITVGLFASADGDERAVLRRMRLTLPVSLGISVLANLVLFPLAPFVLRVFGATYSDEGATILRVMALAGLFFVVKDHFVALRRVQDRTTNATLVMVGFTVAELAAAYVGARTTGGALGLAVGWVCVLAVEAVVLSVPLLLAARPGLLARVPAPARRRGADGADRADGAATVMGVPADPNDGTTAGTPAPRPTTPEPAWLRRGRRLAGRIGPGPALLLMCAGLLPMAYGVASAREVGTSGPAQGLYVLGLLVVFVPAAVGVLLPRARTSTRVLLALAMALLLQLTRLVLYPTRFMFHDELIHANVLRLLGDSGRLFTENSLLPVTSYYPGLEVATDAVQQLTGIAPHTAAVVVLLAARLVIALALLLLVAHLTGSRRAGAAAVVVYACNPQMLFFNSQFSYQTLALPLAVLTVYLVATRVQGIRTSLLPGALATVAVVVTHHVTAVLLISVFVVWWALELGLRRGRPNAGRSLATMVAVAVASFAVTLLNPGNSLVSYLTAIGDSSANALVKVLSGQQQRKVFQNSAGVLTQPWEQVLIIASLVLTLAVLVPALWRARTTLLRRRVAVVTLLVLVAVIYPIIPGGHLTVSTAEVGDRSAGFVFLGVAFVVAWWIWRTPVRWWRTAVLSAGAAVVFLGSIILGAGSVSTQLPGPFRVSDDARTVDADNLAAADWMAQNLPADSRVYADRVGALLAAADGHQYAVTHIGTDVDASRLLLDPQFTPEDVREIKAAGIRYLVADRRNAFGLPNQGVYIESGEYGGDDRTTPVPAEALRKFSSVPGVDVLYDNGSVVVYDLGALEQAGAS